MDKEIKVSIKTVLFFFGMIFAIYVTYLMLPIIISLLLATLIVISMEHAIKYFLKFTVMNKPMTRSFAVLLSYFVFILFVVAIITLGVPPVLNQAQKLIPNIMEVVSRLPGIENVETKSTLLSNFSSLSENLVSTTSSFLSSIAGIFVVLSLSIYMSLDWINIKERFYSWFRGKIKKDVEETVEEIERSIGHWVKGQLLLMLIIGLTSFVGLMILGIEYALALALVSGLLEVVPVLGPVIALFLALIVGLSQSPTKAILVIALYVLIQQVENNYLVPKVMHRVSGFSPLVILISLLVGYELLGVIGSIIAVPAMMVGVILTKKVLKYPIHLNGNK